MNENRVLAIIYEELRLIKSTQRKNIILLKNRSSGDYSVAKVQFRNDDNSKNQRTVRHQGKFLLEMQGHIGIPLMRWVGKDGPFDVLIVEKLGKTLEQYLQMCNGTFSLKTVTMLGLRMLKILINYHEKGYIHKNITSSSFQMGVGNKNTQLYFNDLIDSQTYINKKNQKHIESKSNCKVGKINPFMALHQIEGMQPSRKTDLQSLVYVWIYFLKGKLPWMSEKGHQQLSIKKRLQTILEINLQTLCSQIPIQFYQMLVYTINLQFDEHPNYHLYYQYLLKIMFRYNIEDDSIYDWMTNPKSHKLEIQRLTVSKISPGFRGNFHPYEEEILKQFYEPYFDKVEIDEIGTKYNQIKEKNRIKTEMLFDEEQIMNNNRNTVRNYQQQKKDKCLIF